MGRLTPTIEIEQLARFIGATGLERDCLLHWRKTAAGERAHLYLASVLCCEALAGGLDRTTFLELAAGRLGRLGDAEHRRLALDAVDAFARILPTASLWLDQRRVRAERIGVVWAPLELGGVTITGGPDMRLVERAGDRQVAAGFLTLHASPAFPLDPPAASRAARLLYELALANRPEAIDPRLCVVIDAFSGVISSAASVSDGVLIEAANACSEVVSAWPAL